MADSASLSLQSFGLPSSSRAFGNVTDPVQNGKMPGGVAMDATDPGGEVQTRLATKVDPRSAFDPRSSPLAWVLIMVILLVLLNARDRRGKRHGR